MFKKFLLIVLSLLFSMQAGSVVLKTETSKNVRPGDRAYIIPSTNYNASPEVYLSNVGINVLQLPIAITYTINYTQDRRNAGACMGARFKNTSADIVILTAKHCLLPIASATLPNDINPTQFWFIDSTNPILNQSFLRKNIRQSIKYIILPKRGDGVAIIVLNK